MAATRRTTTTDTTPADFPAPWATRCETYWLPLWLGSPLPADIYGSLEASSPSCAAKDFTGGFGMIQIIRYSDTPVGPYDELLIIPGDFSTPRDPGQRDKNRMRVSRIYVNQKETCYNGRKNWNIPKHLARFEFSAPPVSKGQLPPAQLDISVFPPGTEGTSQLPFFKATITPTSYLPSFPLSTSWIPLNSELIQPPIPQGKDALLCGTEEWRSFRVHCSTDKARIVWVDVKRGKSQIALEGLWPDVKPWRFGVCLEDAEVYIPEPRELDLRPDRDYDVD